MTKTVCPKCNTLAYDDTSFFCHACGARLSVPVPVKKSAGERGSGVRVPKKGSMSVRDDTPLLKKSAPIRRMSPVEICARCGEPVPDENRMYCAKCTAYVRDTLTQEEVTIPRPPVLKAPGKTAVIPPEIPQDTEHRPFREPHPAPPEAAENPPRPGESRWKILSIAGAIAILFLMLVMIVVLMFTFWASVY
jgi:ribosomal protein L37E